MQRFLLFLAVFCSSHWAMSQNTKGWYFSPEIGVSASQATGGDVVGSSTFSYALYSSSYYPVNYDVNNTAGREIKMGWSAGFGIERRFSALFSLKTGLQYENKGNRLPITYVSIYGTGVIPYIAVEGKANNNYNYLTIPLTAKFHIKNVYLLGGLYQSLLLSVHQTGKFKIYPHSDQTEPIAYNHSNKESRLRKGDTGFWLGGGYQKSLPNGNALFSEIRWQRSIASIGAKDMIPNRQQIYNQSFTLSVGYQFQL